MTELFSSTDFIWNSLTVGLYLYFIYICIKACSLFEIKADNSYGFKGYFGLQKEYDKYLETHGCKRFEVIIYDEYKDKESTPEIDDEITKKLNKLMPIELDLCNEYIKCEPNNLFARERAAFIYGCLGKYEEAINDYSYLMNKNPKNFDYVQSCAISYVCNNNLNSALELINNFYKNKKQDSEYFNALGSVFETSKDYQMAIKNYSEAIKLKPDKSYYLSRANVYQKIGEMDKYQVDYDKNEELQNAPYKARWWERLFF